MTVTELKTAVAKRLRIDPTRSMRDMIKIVEQVSGHRKGYRQNGYDYLFAFMGIRKEYGPARWTPEFRPMTAKSHPRAAEIDAQPRPVSMGWTGNGGNSGMGRGR